MVSYSFEGNKRLWNIRDEEENDKIFSSHSKLTSVETTNELQSNHMTPAEYDAEKWPLVQLMRLLRLYAAHRCLWDVNCRDNRNRKMRHAALVDITAALDFGVSKEQVVQKINILRATYRYEKKRIKQRIRKGLGARTKLKWFALADAFLRNVPKKGQKEEDPSNSDSDLEDTIVFTINPETLVPLESEFNEDNSLDFSKHQANSLPSPQEIYSDDSQFNSEWENENIPKELHFPVNIRDRDVGLENQPRSEEEITPSAVKVETSWCLKDSLKFIELLGNHCILFENSLEFSPAQQNAIETIAKEMKFNYKSLEKRWFVLKKVYQEEILKIQQDSLYQPKYKWWSKAQKLFEKYDSRQEKPQEEKETDECNTQDLPTEAIFLTENPSAESSDVDEDYESRFLQNPIPSVAPVSNMNEAMASLFYTNTEDDNLSQESSTNSTLFPKENVACFSSKFVWQGLEDDLLEGKWSLKHSVKFLRLYGVHRCLWDLNDPDYRSRPLRHAAMEDIAASMGHGLTVSYVAKKIKIFRITYMQQRKRLLEATEKGEKPEILLKWFPLADSFLRPHIGLRSIKSDAKEIAQFDYQYVYANLNLIDPALLTDFRGKGTQNAIEIGNDSDMKE